LGLTAILVLSVLGFDLTRSPGDQWSARALLAGIDTYQAFLSQRVEKSGVRCRFQPTCSHYAEAVIRRDGALVGSWKAVGRIARCGPWTPAGTEDQP
jgi:putative membrane protein insertion efficiency factor